MNTRRFPRTPLPESEKRRFYEKRSAGMAKLLAENPEVLREVQSAIPSVPLEIQRPTTGEKEDAPSAEEVAEYTAAYRRDAIAYLARRREWAKRMRKMLGAAMDMPEAERGLESLDAYDKRCADLRRSLTRNTRTVTPSALAAEDDLDRIEEIIKQLVITLTRI